jgi:hypothetical protein
MQGVLRSLLVLAFALVLSGCRNVSTESDYVGVWVGSVRGEEMQLVFNADHSFTWNWNKSSYAGQWRVEPPPNMVSEHTQEDVGLVECLFQDGEDPGMDKMLGYLKRRGEFRLLGTERGEEYPLHCVE